MPDSEVAVTSFANTRLNDQLDRIGDMLERIADALEKLIPNPYTGKP